MVQVDYVATVAEQDVALNRLGTVHLTKANMENLANWLVDRIIQNPDLLKRPETTHV